MRFLQLSGTDPTVNLATEEWLLRTSPTDVFMLWRNAPSIIVGRNQNTRAQINEAFVRARGIPVVRRLTGGGAVFHDLGNVNFTFISTTDKAGRLDFKRFTVPIVEALARLGLACAFDGRNDLLIDGRKVSGNAQFLQGGRVLHHGTLLYAASMTDLSAALLVNPLKYKDKAVDSVASRVTNIAAHLPEPMPIEAFIRFLFEAIAGSDDAGEQPLTPDEETAIALLAARKYRSYDWNFGFSPDYAFHNAVRTAGGMLETHFDVRDGIITALHFYGDFFGRRDVAALETTLLGCAHDYDALRQRLRAVSLEDYILGADVETLINTFF